MACTGDSTMTKDKDFKRLVRARMAKTGEPYTAARANLLAQAPPPLPGDYEQLAGMRDEAVTEATGRTWPEWTAILDAARATEMTHRDTAALLQDEHGVGSWWSQAVTVGYERLRGLRDVGQRRGGGYDVNKSKTIGVPLAELWEAFVDDERRTRWLPEELTIRTTVEGKSIRTRLADETPLQVYFTAKGDHKSTVTLQHERLPDRETADERRAYWGERLQALADLVTGA
jgi:uncharacterized protein YndB with AHSA1/START domain